MGERLRDVRKNIFDMSQDDFGDVVFRGRSTVQSWERGRNEVPPEFVRQLAKLIGAPLRVFSDGGPMPSSVVNGPVYVSYGKNGMERVTRAGEAIAVLSEAVVRAGAILREAPDSGLTDEELRSRAASAGRAAKKTRDVARKRKKKAG